MSKRGDIPKIEDCIKGRVYQLRCRNLSTGVWNGKDGFIGIRTKFAARYLDTEYHYDTGAPYGTVRAATDTGIDVPDDIEARERFPSIDERNGRPVKFSTPVANGGNGWYYVDTGEADQDIKAVSPGNPKLFEFLDKEIESSEIIKAIKAVADAVYADEIKKLTKS